MEDYDPDAFDLRAFVERQSKQERRQLTTEMILEDIDELESVSIVHFLQALLNFVPKLSAVYKDDLKSLMSVYS